MATTAFYYLTVFCLVGGFCTYTEALNLDREFEKLATHRATARYRLQELKNSLTWMSSLESHQPRHKRDVRSPKERRMVEGVYDSLSRFCGRIHTLSVPTVVRDESMVDARVTTTTPVEERSEEQFAGHGGKASEYRWVTRGGVRLRTPPSLHFRLDANGEKKRQQSLDPRPKSANQRHDDDDPTVAKKARYHLQQLGKSMMRISSLEPRLRRRKRDVEGAKERRMVEGIYDSLFQFCADIQKGLGEVSGGITSQERFTKRDDRIASEDQLVTHHRDELTTPLSSHVQEDDNDDGNEKEHRRRPSRIVESVAQSDADPLLPKLLPGQSTIKNFGNGTTTVTCTASGGQPMSVIMAIGGNSASFRMDDEPGLIRRETASRVGSSVTLFMETRSLVRMTSWLYCIAKNQHGDDSLEFNLREYVQWNYEDYMFNRNKRF